MIIIIGLIIVPIYFFNRVQKRSNLKSKFLIYLASSLVCTALIMMTFAWWTDYSNELLMRHYGYDFEPMNRVDPFENVDPENLEKVKPMKISYSGIGWPLKAMMLFKYYVPYILLVYLVGILFSSRKRNTEPNL